MIEPLLKDDALLRDIAAAPDDAGVFHLWWLGQSGFLLKWQGLHLLLDPYLSDSLTVKYAHTDKPHVRMTARCIDPARLDFIDLVTSSHHHTDHFDADTLVPLAKVNPKMKLILPEANLALARERLGKSVPEMIGLDDGKIGRANGFSFVGIPAAHNEVERDEKALCKYLGFVVKFGGFAVYHSGDTLWHRDLVRAIAPHAPDVALVPINGNKPERRVAGNLNGLEAAAVAKACGATIAIPHHFEMFEFNTEPPDEFVAFCERLGQGYKVLRCGERFKFAG